MIGGKKYLVNEQLGRERQVREWILLRFAEKKLKKRSFLNSSFAEMEGKNSHENITSISILDMGGKSK